MTSSIQSITERLIEFRDERDWKQFHTLKNLASALSVEAAELLELTQWKSDKELESVKGDAADKQKFSSEIADVFAYLLLICEKLDIDPIAAAEAKIIENARKYPVDKSRGKATKYSDL